MQKKIFKENLLKVSSRKIEELEKAVNFQQFSFKKILTIGNLSTYSLLFVLLGGLIIAFSYGYLPEKIPLYYSRSWGVEQLSSKNQLFIIPLTTLFFFLLNYAGIKILSKKWGEFLPLMLSFVSVALCFVGLIAIIKIVFLMI